MFHLLWCAVDWKHEHCLPRSEGNSGAVTYGPSQLQTGIYRHCLWKGRFCLWHFGEETCHFCHSCCMLLIQAFSLVWRKSDQIGFLIVELQHQIIWLIVALLLHAYAPVDRIGFCILRRRRLSSEITARKSIIVHLVCVIIMYTIYEVYKDVASSRSSYAILLKCWGSWWSKEVSRRCFCYH